jgi:hypothetical protein
MCPMGLDWRCEGIKRERPSATGSIAMAPGASSVRWRRQGAMDKLLVCLEPSLVARVAAFKRLVGVTPRQFICSLDISNAS